jgi:ABC-type nitrate/sulfonate/bicarbonate transport system permease component
MLVGILVLAGLGKLSDTALRRIERRALRWTDGFEGR